MKLWLAELNWSIQFQIQCLVPQKILIWNWITIPIPIPQLNSISKLDNWNSKSLHTAHTLHTHYTYTAHTLHIHCTHINTLHTLFISIPSNSIPYINFSTKDLELNYNNSIQFLQIKSCVANEPREFWKLEENYIIYNCGNLFNRVIYLPHNQIFIKKNI